MGSIDPSENPIRPSLPTTHSFMLRLGTRSAIIVHRVLASPTSFLTSPMALSRASCSIIDHGRGAVSTMEEAAAAPDSLPPH